jgi:hypothetical protein
VLALDAGHIPLVVTFASGRSEVVQPLDLLGAQFDAVGRRIFLDARDPLGPWNRGDVVTLREQPRQGHLRRCRTGLAGNRFYFVDDVQIALEVLAGETRVGLPPIVVGKLLG